MTTTHRVRSRDLEDGVGALAFRDGDVTVVHVSPQLPHPDSVVGYVLTALCGDPAPYGCAQIMIASTADIPTQRGAEPLRL
ncbi:MAG: hypothetical protein ACRDTZ_16350 [Pseudonocardiaceae bacterium]